MVVKATTIQNPVIIFGEFIVTPVLKNLQRITSNALLMASSLSEQFRDDLGPFWGDALTNSYTATSCQEGVVYRTISLVLEILMSFLAGYLDIGKTSMDNCP